MKFDELNEDQKMCAKQDFMLGLADKGRFMEVIYGLGNGPERDPSYGELAEADILVDDETMRREGVNYVTEDFAPIEDHYDMKHPSRWELIEIHLRDQLGYNRFLIENPQYQILRDRFPYRKILGDVFNWIDLSISRECDKARNERKNECNSTGRNMI